PDPQPAASAHHIDEWWRSPTAPGHAHAPTEVSPLEVCFIHEPVLAHEASMNEEGRPPRRNRPRRRPDGGSRRVAPRPAYARRRPDYATGGYSSIYSRPFPTDETGPMEPLSLAELQAKPVDELRELGAEHGIEGAEEMEHQGLWTKLPDAVTLA